MNQVGRDERNERRANPKRAQKVTKELIRSPHIEMALPEESTKTLFKHLIHLFVNLFHRGGTWRVTRIGNGFSRFLSHVEFEVRGLREESLFGLIEETDELRTRTS